MGPESEPIPGVAIVGQRQLVARAAIVVVPGRKLHSRARQRLELREGDRGVIGHVADDAIRNPPE
jgi:hypothetical protein